MMATDHDYSKVCYKGGVKGRAVMILLLTLCFDRVGLHGQCLRRLGFLFYLFAYLFYVFIYFFYYYYFLCGEMLCVFSIVPSYFKIYK